MSGEAAEAAVDIYKELKDVNVQGKKKFSCQLLSLK